MREKNGRTRRRPAAPVERLEVRSLLAVTASLVGTNVTFDGAAASGNLYLRSNAGLLEWSVSSSGAWTSDLDTSASGTNSLSLAGGLTVASSFDGSLNLGTIQTAGGALSITAAGALNLGSGSIVSTRRVASGASHLSDNSTGNSGSLTLRAQVLALAANSAVLANASNGYAAAKVSLIAEQTASDFIPAVHIKTATAGINVNGATIKGGQVVLHSSAVSDQEFSDDSEGGDWTFPDALASLSAFGGISVATSTSNITLLTGSRIEGSNVELHSTAQTSALVKTTALDKQLAFAYGKSKPTSTIDVQSGATIVSSGSVDVASTADSKIDVSAKRGLSGPSKTGSDASFTIGISESTVVSTADLAGTITAGGNVDVVAKTVKHHSTGASSGAYEDGSVGIAFAMSDGTSDTSASLGGTVTAGGDVHVDSDSRTLKNDTQTASGVGTGVGAGLVIKVKDGLQSAAGKLISKLQPTPKPASGSTTKLAVSAAFTYAKDVNHSAASIADGASVTANGDLRVKSHLVFVPETSATATVDSEKMDKENPSGNTKENSISAAINIGSFTNTSDAHIGKNATVDAKKTLRVDARTVQPYDIQWLNLNGIGDITDKFNSNLGIQNGFITSWAQSNAQGEKTGIAGSINVTSYDNDTNAYVDTGAKVNQDKTARTDQQHVSVTALNDVESVNLSGVFGLKFFNPGGGVAGAGGSYLDLTQTNKAKAVIRGGASVYGGSLLVRANSITRSINIAEAGGRGSDYAVYGSVSLVTIDNTSVSQIDDGATVLTGTLKIVLPKDFQDLFGEQELTGLGEKIFGASDYMSSPYERVPLAFDSNQDGKVDANDDGIASVGANDYNTNLNTLVSAEDGSQVFNIAGGIAKGKNVGIGVGVALTDVGRDTFALIGNRKDETDDLAGSVTANGKLAVQAANHGTFDTHALAAAVATPDSDTTKDEKQKNQKDAKKGGGKFGLGVSGDAAVNEIDDHAKASINDSTVTATGPARVTAENESIYRTVGGAVAIGGGSNSSAGLAGTYVSNILTNETRATVDDSTLTAGGVVLDARQSGDVLAVGASGTGSSGFLALAGSASVNTIDNDTIAGVSGGSTVTTTGAGAVTINAKDDSKILAVAGALAGGGGLGIGASFAWNSIDATTEASIRGSDVNSAGAMGVTATNDTDIRAVSAAVGISVGNMAPAAAITVSEIHQDTTAVIDGKKTAAGVDVTGDLTITATSTGTVQSIAGNISASFGAAGVGGSGAWNEISGATTAGLINAADVTVSTAAVGSITGAVAITAKNEASIETISAGVAAAASNAIGGSVSLNRLRTTAEADVTGASKLVAQNGIAVTATNTSTIKSLAGQIAFGSGGVAVGVAAAYNDIADKTYATVDGGSVTANSKSVLVSASSTPTINTIAVGGTASGGVVGVAGSVAVNLIANDTQATLNETTVTAKDNVSVLANTGGTITFYGGVISGSLGGGIGATAAVNSIANKTKALVTDSTVNAKGTAPIAIPRADGSGATDSVRGVSAVATDSIDVDVIVANASGGIKAGIAGTVAVTTRDDTTQAQISGSTINASQSGADAATGVRVRALSKADIDSKAGGVALGGVAGVGATAGTVIDTSDTSATIAGGSSVHANGTVEAISNSRTRVNNIAVSGGLSLGTGVAGSVSVVKIDQTNEAAIDGSTVEAGGNLTVNADDDVILGKQADGTKTGILAGAVGIGVGSAGIGGTILVNQVDNTTTARITDSSTDARGTTTVKADQFTDVTSYGVTAAGGSYVGVAGTISVNSIKNTTVAQIEEVSGATEVNQDAAFKNASQHVNVQAVDTATLEAKNGSLSAGGIVGAGASVDVSTIKNVSSAAIGANTKVAAGGSVSVDADGSKTVDVTVVAAGGGAIGVQGSVAVLGIGGAITGEALGQINGKGNPGGSAGEVTSQANGGLDSGILGGESTGTAALTNSNAATGGVSVSSEFSTSGATSYGVTASIGATAEVNAGGKLSLTADDVVKIKQTAGAVAGGILGIGGGVAIATIRPSATASVAGGASIDAGGAVEVIATGKLNDSDVTAAAGAAGVVGLGAAVAKLNSTTTATATFGGTLNSAGSLKVDSSITSDIHAEAKGATIGAAAVGVVIANASESGSALSSLGSTAKVGQTGGKTVGSLQVTAGSDTKVVGNSTAAAGGIVSGSGSVASAYNTPTVRAYADAGSKMTVTGNALLRGVALGGVSTTADGVNIGGITVGVSTATGNWSPTVEAGLRGSTTAGGGASLAAGSADVRAYQNYKTDGTLDTTRTLRATAKTANGSLIGGTGSTASVSSDADVRSTLGQNTTATIAGKLNVAARSAHNALATADGKSYGLAAASVTTSLTTVDNDSVASTGSGAKVTAGAADFTADTNIVANSTATGGYGGLIGVGGTESKTNVNSDNTRAGLGGLTVLTATGEVLLQAFNTLDLDTYSQVDSAGGITANEVKGTVNVNSGTTAEIGSGANVTADKVSVVAKDIKTDILAKTYSKTYAAASDNTANSYVTANVTANANIDANAVVYALQQLNLVSRQEAVSSVANAKTEIGAGVTGKLTSRASNNLTAKSKVNTGVGSKLTTKDLEVDANTPQISGGYEQIADTEAQTVMKWVSKIVGEACSVVVEIFTFGLADGDEVCEPVVEFVQEATYSAENQVREGTQNRGTQIDFNSDVTILGAPNPTLVVDASGKVTKAENVTYTDDGSTITVADIANTSTGKVHFNAPKAQMSGTASFTFLNTFDVLIQNASGKNVVVNGVSVWNKNKSEPDLVLPLDESTTGTADHTHVGANANFHYTVNNSFATAKVDVQNTGNSDVTLKGLIDNPGGTTTIGNTGTGGDILASGGAQDIETRVLSVSAAHGTIGTAANKVNARIVQAADLTPSLSFSGDGGVFAALAGVLRGAGSLSFNQASITSNGPVGLTLKDGVRQSISNGQVVSTTRASTYSFTSFTAKGNITIDAGSVATVNLVATISQTDNGKLVVTANGDVTLAETNGAMRVGSVTSTGGNVSLTSDSGSVVDADSDAAADVTGNAIALAAPSTGSVGTASDTLEINSSFNSAGTVTATAGTGVYLAETSDDLKVKSITTTGDVVLAVQAGSILDQVAPASPDIVGRSLTLDASNGAGTAANPLDAAVGKLEASVGTGGLTLINTGALVIGGISSVKVGVASAGGVNVTALSPMSIEENATAAGAIVFTATDKAAAGDDLTVKSGATVKSTGSSVALKGGDNLTVETGAAVTAATTATFIADYNDADAGAGVTLALLGTVTADTALVQTGADNDIVTLAGVTAGTETTVQTFAGADTVNVRGIAAATSVDGGTGNDTVNLGSTAGTTAAGVADGINATLTVAGGADSDTINVDDRADTSGDAIRLTKVTLTGPFGANGKLTYGTAEYLNLNLGTGDDTVVMVDNGASTTVNANGGADRFRVGPILNEDGFVQDDVVDGVATKGADIAGNSFATTLNGGEGNDYFIVNRNKADLTLNGDNGDDTFELNTAVDNLGTSTVAGGDGTDQITYLENAPVQVNGGAGFDTIIVNGSIKDDRIIVTADSIQVVGSREAGFTGIEAILARGKKGNDTFDVDTTVNKAGNAVASSEIVKVELEGNFGGDTFNLRGLLGTQTMKVSGNEGDDTFVVGSTAPTIGGTVNKIAGALTILGGSNQDGTPDADKLIVDDSGDGADNAGTMTATAITGLGMGAAGIAYDGVESLNAKLGSGNDTFNVRSTAAIAKTLVEAGSGNDTINLGSLAPATGGTANAIAGPITVDGQGGSDTMNVDDRAETVATTAILTQTTLDGVSPATITYAALETLNIDTGVADDVVNVRGTSAVTTIRSNNGNDRFYVADTANVKAGGPYPAYLFGNVNQIAAQLNLDGGAGTQSLMVSDSTATAGDANVTLTKSSITGLAPAAMNYTASGDYRGGITVWASQGADNVNVTSTLNTGGGRTVTTLNLGGGDDKASAVLGAADGFFVANGQAGNDAINGAASTRSLYLFGGVGNDTLTGGSAADVILGDTGRVEFRDSTGKLGTMIGSGGDASLTVNIADDQTDGVERLATAIYTLDPTRTGNDVIGAGAGNDIVLGGNGRDSIAGGADSDLLLGDNGRVAGSVDASKLPVGTGNMPFTITSTETAAAQGDADTVSGDDGADIVLGGQAGDSMAGGAGDDDLVGGHNVAGGSDAGDAIDGGLGNDAIAGDNASIVRNGNALSPRIRKLTGSAMYDAAGNLLVSSASQLDPRGAVERAITLFDHSTSADAGTSGNDSIAGGGGDDKVFGQLGTDAIQGDGAINAAPANAATDGDDYVEGGGGNDSIFGNGGQDDLIGGSSSLYGLTTAAQRPDGSDTIYGGSGTKAGRYDDGDAGQNAHSSDADVILGDNGNVLRLSGANGQYLRFAYDLYGSLGITPRGVQQLDYTLGGASIDLGGDDLLGGEAGDDTVYGQTGNDVLFGQGQDDDLIGGIGHDRIYGGNGEDGVLGDDGVIRTSRNGLAEPLSGLNKANAETNYSLPGPFTGFWGYVQGRLQKDVTLLAPAKGGNDLVYGGNGDDFLHGGAGDDAISGAEAQAAYYNALPVSQFNPLGYDAKTRKLSAYNANDPLRKIDGFLLNFDATDANGAKVNDGKDRVFGDWGHDWLVGGTNNDRLFGGNGDDVINADDNLETNGGLNNRPDASAFADADFVYGGDGLDVMIANTGGDRLFDWSGEFNTYLVPFAAFGEPTVSRSPSPQIQQFLLDLARESGADQSNNGPTGEIGLFTQKDPQWGQNNGSPRDPQPGNIGGTQRDTQGGPEDDRSKRQSLNAQYAIVG